VNWHTISLSWFRPLLGCNSPTTISLILKMNSGYTEVSGELKKLAKRRGKCSCASCLMSRGGFYRPGDGRITMN
jgi:hypothetical protein